VRSRSLISLSRVLLLCALFALVVIEIDSANGSLTKKASVELHVSQTSITYPCLPQWHSRSGSCPTQSGSEVALASEASGFHKHAAYTYVVTGGRIVGEGSKVAWDLTKAGPGTYTATVEVHDSNNHRAGSSVNVTVSSCGDCVVTCDLPCPMMAVTCYDQVKAGTPITCKVNVQGSSAKCNALVGFSPEHIIYKWSARSSNGNDLSEAITNNGAYVSIPTNGRAGQTIYATVELPGLDPTCSSSASSSTKIRD